MYRIDPSCYGAMFPLPAKAADICLQEASENEIKVLLHLFCSPENGISVDGLSSALHLSADAVLSEIAALDENVLSKTLSSSGSRVTKKPLVPVMLSISSPKNFNR